MTHKKLWWQHGIIYQIYPRSFQDTNNDGIGDLPGIIQRLDYLQDLGVDGIWLSPVNPSPDVDFGYDVADYNTIDPKFGTLEDFDQLIQEAHKRDIHIILDLVLNHTSDQHRWFQESRKSKDNSYHDWYLWRDPAPNGGVPNNWLSTFGGPGWKYDAHLNQYYFHMFCPEQPDLNWRNPDVRQAMLDVFKYWLDRGVDGFRLDVFNEYYKHPLLLDNPKKPGFHLRPFDRFEHIHDNSQPEMFPLLQDIRKLMNSYPERYTVGETFMADPVHARMYIGPDVLHAGFDYTYAKSDWSPRSFGNAIQYWDTLHGENAWPNYFLNNHDTPRSSTRYVTGESDARLKLLACMHLTVRGTPYLYYGEEIGMRDIKVSRTHIQDPAGKRYWPIYKGRDGCRSPMQWDSSGYSGFSRGKPWLHLHPDYPARNVLAQSQDQGSLLQFYKDLIKIRRNHPALYEGSLQLLPLEQESVLVYKRSSSDEQALVILNFSNQEQIQNLPAQESEGKPWQIIFAGNEPVSSSLEEKRIHLPPYGLAILIV
ncbi:MAG: alpha-glucosidase [Anaerolineaceae bacterium]